VVHALLLFAVVNVIVGCARHEPSRFATAPPPPGMHSIFVIAHAHHSGLIVRAQEVPRDAWPARRDFPDAEFLVMGWGDREYYPHDDPGVSLGMRALFTAGRLSTLNVIPVSGSLTEAFPGSEAIELHVSDDGFQRLVAFVRKTYELDAQGRAIPVRSGVRHAGRFYASARTFHALENCNTWVARALRHAGFDIHPGSTLTAGTLLRRVRPLSAAYKVAFSGSPLPAGFRGMETSKVVWRSVPLRASTVPP
jgi:uncharacterized protein (TIGR02117 family)